MRTSWTRRGQRRGAGRRACALGLGGAVAGLVIALPATAADARGHAPDGVRAGAVLVGFDPGVSAGHRHAVERGVGGSAARPIGAGVRLMHVAPGRVQSAVRSLRARGDVRYAEPDRLMHEDGAPNDPSFGSQWGFSNTGQLVDGTGGSAGADERALPAWNVTTGSPSVVVAETDSGVDYTHPDLAANIWSNPGGIGGCALGTHGYNARTATCDPMDDETYYGGHGTHVAGIIGAVGGNGIGVTGVNWRTSILPVKWLDSSGWGYTSQLIAALDWVLQAKRAGVNVRVVNDSATFVGTGYSQALSDEIDKLGANDILFVTAAGNTAEDNDDLTKRRYPCGYDRPTEICVTASDQSDRLASFANYGASTVDLAAPGANVYSTLRDGRYGYVSGGSMASPQVAGAAALILSRGYRSATALKADILDNVDVLPSLEGRVRTGGRLDICKALPGCAADAPASGSPPTVSGSAREGQALTTQSGSWSGNPTGYAYQWQRCDASGAACTTISGEAAPTYTLDAADVGATVRVVVRASNSAGSTGATSSPTGVVAPAGETFGTPTVGTLSDTMAADRKRVNRYSLSTSASVTKLTAYLAPTGTSGQQLVTGVIYADAGGAPGALVARSDELAFHSTDAAGWYALPLPSPVTLAPGDYWIGLFSGGSTGVAGFRWDSVPGSRIYNTGPYASGPSDPFGSSTALDGEQMSLYATYTAAPPPPTAAPPPPTAPPPTTPPPPVGNQPPTASFTASPRQASKGQAVAFRSSSSDPDGRIASYAWAFGDGAHSTASSPSHAYSRVRTYTATLTVTDDKGARASTSGVVTVRNRRLQASFAVVRTRSAHRGGHRHRLRFRARVLAGPRRGAHYRWRFGDHRSARRANVWHTYRHRGRYTVRLTVVGAGGQRSIVRRRVRVR